MYLRCFDLSAIFSAFLSCKDVGYAIHDMCMCVSQKNIC